MGFFNDMKTCRNCKTDRDLSNFSKDKSTRDGLNNCCKLCNKKYRIDNKESIKTYLKEYYKNNKENLIKYKKKYRVLNKENIKQKRLHNFENIKKYQKEYNINNKEKVNKQRRLYNKNRKETDPLYKLTCNIRTLINVSIKGHGYTKKSKTYQILGCSYEEFKQHLESQFTEGMTWANAGEWELDHIYPVSRAINEEHLIKLNHYTNFQPLWAEDNNKKNNKIKGVAENLIE